MTRLILPNSPIGGQPLFAALRIGDLVYGDQRDDGSFGATFRIKRVRRGSLSAAVGDVASQFRHRCPDGSGWVGGQWAYRCPVFRRTGRCRGEWILGLYYDPGPAMELTDDWESLPPPLVHCVLEVERID